MTTTAEREIASNNGPLRCRRLDIRDSCLLSLPAVIVCWLPRRDSPSDLHRSPGPCEVCNAGRTRARQTAYRRRVQARELPLKVAARSLLCDSSSRAQWASAPGPDVVGRSLLAIHSLVRNWHTPCSYLSNTLILYVLLRGENFLNEIDGVRD